MGSIIKLILGAVLRFFWDRAEEWYQTELRYQQHKRILIEEAKNAAREIADKDKQIALDIESVDDSFMRLERFAEPSNSNIGVPLFGAFVNYGESRDSIDDTGEPSEVSLPVEGSTGSLEGFESSGSEPVDSGTDSALPSTERGV